VKFTSATAREKKEERKKNREREGEREREREREKERARRFTVTAIARQRPAFYAIFFNSLSRLSRLLPFTLSRSTSPCREK